MAKPKNPTSIKIEIIHKKIKKTVLLDTLDYHTQYKIFEYLSGIFHGIHLFKSAELKTELAYYANKLGTSLVKKLNWYGINTLEDLLFYSPHELRKLNKIGDVSVAKLNSFIRYIIDENLISSTYD